MRRSTILAFILTVVLSQVTSLTRLSAQTTQPTPTPKVRIGTFDLQLVVVAYYGSPIHEKHLKELMAEHDQAKRAGDKTKAAQLESQGEAEQELAHKQLAGVAPIDNIVSALEPSLPEIASAAHVDAIISHATYVGPNATLVDVTDRMINQLNPNERARKAIDDLRIRQQPQQEGSVR